MISFESFARLQPYSSFEIRTEDFQTRLPELISNPKRERASGPTTVRSICSCNAKSLQVGDVIRLDRHTGRQSFDPGIAGAQKICGFLGLWASFHHGMFPPTTADN